MKCSKRYERMNPSQLAEAVKKRPIAWLPLGPLEWHGEAIALGCDPMIATAVVEQAWQKAGGVLLPTLYAGVGSVDKEGRLAGFLEQWGIHACAGKHNPGSVYTRPLTFELLIHDMLFFLECTGFKLCILHSGHGDCWHRAILERIEEQWQGRPMKFVYWAHHAKSLKPYPKAWKKEIQETGVAWNVVAGHHGDFNEASSVGAIDPHLVDKRRFGLCERDRAIGIKNEHASLIDYGKGEKTIKFRAKQMAAEVTRLYATVIKDPKPALQGHLRKLARVRKSARPLNPPVGAWKASLQTPGSGGLARAPCMKMSGKSGWQDAPSSVYYFANGAAGWEIKLCDLFRDSAGLVYIGNRFKVTKGGQWAILLGHDGAAKVFVDGQSVFYESNSEDPTKPLVSCFRFHHRAYRSMVFVTLTKGIHEVMMGFNAGQQLGDSITFRFLPTSDIARKLEAWEQL